MRPYTKNYLNLVCNLKFHPGAIFGETHFSLSLRYYSEYYIKGSLHLQIHSIQFLFKQSVQTYLWKEIKTGRTLLVEVHHSFLVFMRLGKLYCIASSIISTFFDAVKVSIFESCYGHFLHRFDCC